MELNAYLSGGMEFANGYGADWREQIEAWLKKKLGHTSFNPVKTSDKFLKSHYPGIDFRKSKLEDLDTHMKIAREIVRLDSGEIILHSDYVICYYDESAQRGAGTKGELTVAALFSKPVYFVAGMSIPDIPSWVLGCITEMFGSFDDLKSFLEKKYLR